MQSKQGGDSADIAAAGTESGNDFGAAIGVSPAVLGALALGMGFSASRSGDATVLQGQNTEGGDASDNIAMGGAGVDS